ncbi:molybdopterin synthase catalytic subunit MoaE [Pontivivens nitratireducens]|uniref:molybdopterin synthase catalytic subunit MoaE n=1 Tax=Pontivivens nitratireducens TaxID=2758038 RepID=UPI00163AF1E3|nr:molybdopterin synthase catalytic subunit MoaE [Pontibrevibacter nitratireducens]
MSVSVQIEDFDISQEIGTLKAVRTDIGAVVTFTGLVRDMGGGQPVSAMELEHWPGMTEQALEEIETQARQRWSLKATRIVHRYGALKPGDQIVLVIAASPHRGAAFEAAEFMMDFLKTRAPFWKKETTPQGARWVDARDADDTAQARWDQP